MYSIWTEKYRPKTFKDFKGQEKIVERIKAMVDQKNIGNFLFAGPAGVGKSSMALIIARTLFGEYWKQNFLEKNASDDRGIDVVRNEIKDFARLKAIGNIPFKIIFLDEADALTKEAQQALRRTMESFTNTTRFILSCVTPDTKILLPGEIETNIGEFIKKYQDKKQIKVQNINNECNSTKSDLVLAAVQMPPSLIGKKVFEITTMTGRKIQVTDDHMLLTVNGWKPAKDITKSDKLLVYPHLEGTGLESLDEKIINLEEFTEFISKSEEECGLKRIGSASMYRQLKTKEKNKIIKRILELKKVIDHGSGLTKRELEVYKIIKENKGVSRKGIENKICLSRIRTVQLLKSIENKGYIQRDVHKKVHFFISLGKEPEKLRNFMDIKNCITKEFNLNISYRAIRDALLEKKYKGRTDRVLGELKRKGLLDLTYNDIEKIGVISRVSGFLLGDGHLAKNDIRLHFSGNKDALLNVKSDLELLGYSNHSKIVSKRIVNNIQGRTIKGESTSFSLDSVALSLFFQYLGIPKGDKSITKYDVPKFVRNGTRFVKREFLRAVFGCDGDKPKWKVKNCGTIALRQNKVTDLKESMFKFYRQSGLLLEEFEVRTYINVRDKGEVRRKDNKKVLTVELHIKANNKNMFNFLSRVGYAYENYKQALTRLSSEYLRHKLYLIKLLENKSVNIIQEYDGLKVELAKKYGVTTDFVSNRLKGKKVNLPRKGFLDFDKWVKKYSYNTLLLANEILEIKETNASIVMDITCNEDHNFITNSFVSHNCNYSSKIIDPIQSRCTVFRFKPLDKKDFEELIEFITKGEGLKVDKDAIDAMYEVCDGDARRMKNILQSCAAINKNITENLIYDLVSAARPKEVKEVLEIAIKGDFIQARNKLLDVMLQHGLSGLDIIKQIQKEIWNLKISDEKKVQLIDKCGDIEFRMVEGSDEFIQLESLLANFILK